MYTLGVPESELYGRLDYFQKILQQKSIDAALILHKPDLFYFSGTIQQGWLFIPAEGEPVFMVFKEFERARAESALKKLVSHLSPKTIPEKIIEEGYPLPKTLGLELDVLPANQYLLFKSIFKQSRLTDVSTEIKLQRAVKSDYEIDKISKAAGMADKVAARVPDILKEGMTEIELAGRLESYARSLGHQGIIRMRMWGNDLFYGHIMSGASAAVPSYFASPTGGAGLSPAISQGPGFNKIRRNEPVLVDYVFVLDGYTSDHTRIFAVDKLPQELMQAHAAMLEIQTVVKQKAIPGVLSGDLYELMINMAKDAGYEKYFMGAGERKIRFTGHGLGLELDEFPFIAKGQKLPLEKGMVIALEPKVVIPGKGVVGIENTLLVTETGLESLTKISDEIVFV